MCSNRPNCSTARQDGTASSSGALEIRVGCLLGILCWLRARQVSRRRSRCRRRIRGRISKDSLGFGADAVVDACFNEHLDEIILSDLVVRVFRADVARRCAVARPG